MKEKKGLFILIGVIFVLIVVLLTLNAFNVNILDTGKYKYHFKYYDNYIPGSTYEIFVYNNKVEIEETAGCSIPDCEPAIEKHKYQYSKDNINKLYKFLDSISYEDGMEINRNSADEKTNEIITALLLDEKYFELAAEENDYKYELYYSDEVSYVLYLKNDNSVLVKKITVNDEYSITKIDTYSLSFSDKHMDIIRDFIKNHGETKYNKEAYDYIVKSIAEGKEDYLDKIDTSTELVYKITYDGLNCPTPILYLYSNNTYEYYYTFTTTGKTIIPSTSTYNYDISKIINSASNYEERPSGPYYITDKDGNKTKTYDSNVELNEFLNSINVTLAKCAEEQE